MSGLRLGPGAATGYPFVRREDALKAPSLLDLQVTSASIFNNGVFLGAIDPIARSLAVVSGDGQQLVSLSDPDVKIIAGRHYWHWYAALFNVRATVDPTQAGYSGERIALVSRVIEYDDNNLAEVVFETLQGEVSSLDKPMVLRGGFNTNLTTDGVTLNVAVSPGNGTGNVQRCSEDGNEVRSIAGGSAGPTGNFTISADSCFRIQPEISANGEVRTVVNGSYYLHDDCEACCRCDEKAAVWRLAKEMQDKLIPMVQRYQELRNIYNAKVASIQSGNDCLTRPLLNADLVNIDSDTARLYVSVCNGTTETLQDVRISVSPLFIPSGQRYSYIGLPQGFFDNNKGVIKIPDNDEEFYSLSEQLARARHLNLEPADFCNHGYAYSTGSKNHLKFPGEVVINRRPFNPAGYEIANEDISINGEEKQVTNFYSDGGFDFNLHCIEPGDTRYFSLTVEFVGVANDIVDGVPKSFEGLDTNISDARKIALIVNSPTHPEINYSVKMGTGGIVPCDPDEIIEDEE